MAKKQKTKRMKNIALLQSKDLSASIAGAIWARRRMPTPVIAASAAPKTPNVICQDLINSIYIYSS